MPQGGVTAGSAVGNKTTNCVGKHTEQQTPSTQIYVHRSVNL